MPPRKRKKSGATRKTEAKSSVFSWLVMAVLLAAFVAFLIHLDQLPEPGKGSQLNSKPAMEKKHSKNQPEAKKHQFDFYTVLPDRQVELAKPEKTIVRPKSKVKSVQNHARSVRSDKKVQDHLSSKAAISSKKPSNQLYQLQVGAFSELNKADTMKARLAFLGVESNIQVIRNNNRQMYRVRVGPSTDKKKIEQLKAQLKAQNINTFIQKL